MDRIQVLITKNKDDGSGEGVFIRPDGKEASILVPYMLEKEVVEVLPVRRRRTYQGELPVIQTPSPARVEPVCSHFGICGGCSFQHMEYGMQLARKQKKIEALFSCFTANILPVIASKEIWRYRNKMEFSFSQDKAGRKYLGLIMRATRGHVFTLEECHLAPHWMSLAVGECRSWWHDSCLDAYVCMKDTGSLRTLTLRHSETTGDRVVMLTVSANPDFAIKRKALEEFTARMQQIAQPESPGSSLSIVLRLQQVMKKKPTQFYEMLLSGPDFFREKVAVFGRELEFQISPSSFFQPNSLQSRQLYSTALELAALQKDEVLYDLYAGIGVFGMCASHQVRRVISIELSCDSAYDAKCNVQRLGITNVDTFQGDVAELLEKGSFPRADVLIVDPPRVGLQEKTIGHIAELGVKRIIYVSCNPETQAKDAEALCWLGYTLTCVQPVDQFPHTPHIENIAVFHK
jgi:23S rRNA (uracil1939-C5)-methyltransferase